MRPARRGRKEDHTPYVRGRGAPKKSRGRSSNKLVSPTQWVTIGHWFCPTCNKVQPYEGPPRRTDDTSPLRLMYCTGCNKQVYLKVQ